MSNDNLLDQTICNLPFEVVAIYDDEQNTNSNLPPSVNVKIRIRNKENTGTRRHGIISLPKLTAKSWPKKVRLVNSAQTIMSFNLALEPHSDEAQKKSNRKLFQMFRPGGCLSIRRDEDVYSYMPSTSTELKRKSASGIEDYESSKLTGAFSLKKNDFSSSYTNTLKTPKTFLGKCKPGGCLDPPFGEDKYTYKPTGKDAKSLQQPVINTNSVHPGISNLDIEPKSTTQDKQINILRQSFPETKVIGKTARLLTYPSTLSSSKLKTKDSQNTKLNLRMQSEHRQLTSEFPEAYFILPKKESSKNGKSYDTYNYEKKEHKIKEAYVNKDYILQSQTPSEVLSDALTITSQSFDEPLGGVMKGNQAVRELNSITPLFLKSEGLLNNKTSKEDIKTISTTVSAKGLKIDENTLLQEQNFSNHNNIPIVENIFSNIKENKNVLNKHISRSNSSIKINAIQKTAEDNNNKKKIDLHNKLELEDKHQSMLYSLGLSNEMYTKSSKNSIDQRRLSLVNFDIREDNNLPREHQNIFDYDLNKTEITAKIPQITVIDPIIKNKSGSLENEYDKNISAKAISHVIIKDDNNSETDHSMIREQRRDGDSRSNFDKNINEQMLENISEPVKLLGQDLEIKDNDNMEKLVDQGIERTEQKIYTFPSVESDILPKIASLHSSLHSLNEILSLKNSHSDLISPNDSYMNQKDNLLNNESSKSIELTNEKRRDVSFVNQKVGVLNNESSKSKGLTNEKSKNYNYNYVNQKDSLINNESSKSTELTNEKRRNDSFVNQKVGLLNNESSKSKGLTNEKSENDNYVNQKDSLLNNESSKSTELMNEKSKNDSYVNQKDSLLSNQSSNSTELNNKKRKNDRYMNQKDNLLSNQSSNSSELTNKKRKNDSYVNQKDNLLNNESSKSKGFTNEKSKNDSYMNQKNSLLKNERSKSTELTIEKSKNDSYVNQRDNLLDNESSKPTELTNEKSKNYSYVNQKDILLDNESSKSTELTNEKSKSNSYENQKDILLDNESSKSTELTNEKSKNDSYVNQKDSLLNNERSKSTELTNEKSKNDSYVNQKDSLLNNKRSKSTELTNEKSQNDSYVNQKDSLLKNERSKSTELTNEKSKADEQKQKSLDSLENTLSSSVTTGYMSSQKTDIDKKISGFSVIIESQEKKTEIISKTGNLDDADVTLLPKMLQLNDLAPNIIKLDDHNRTKSQQAFSIVSKIKTSKDTLETIETVPILRQGFTDSDSLQHRKSLDFSTSKSNSKNVNTFINDSKMLLPNLNPDINVNKIDILSDDKFRKPTNELTNGNLRSPQTLSNTIIYRKSDIENSDKTSSLKLNNVKELNLIYPTRETKKSFADSNKNINSISSIALNLGFHTFANEKNGFSIETFDPSTNLASYPQENIFKIKTILRKNDSEIKIKIDSETNLTMQIKPIRQLDGSRKLASNVVNGNTNDKRKDNIRVYSSEILIKKDKLLQETLKAVYETLIPIEKNIIKLKEEADSLYREQLLLKEGLLSKEIKPNRIMPNIRTCSCLQREIGLDMKNY